MNVKSTGRDHGIHYIINELTYMIHTSSHGKIQYLQNETGMLILMTN